MFEQKSDYQDNGRLGAQSRPHIIGNWIQRARLSTYRPDIRSVKDYADNFATWWKSLQPEWRANVDSTSAPNNASWEDIRRPGVNGLLSVVTGLFFWGCAIQNMKVGAQPAAKKHWIKYVNDVSFVLSNLV